MPMITKFRPRIPVGMRVFEDSVQVAVNNRLKAARNFAKRHRRRIYLNRATDHADDPGAIRVIGKSKGWIFEKNECIGYVPTDIAYKLVHTDMEDKVKVRLYMILIDGKDSIKIHFDIFGPKDDYGKYSSIM
jgi:hypothetical protein